MGTCFSKPPLDVDIEVEADRNRCCNPQSCFDNDTCPSTCCIIQFVSPKPVKSNLTST